VSTGQRGALLVVVVAAVLAAIATVVIVRRDRSSSPSPAASGPPNAAARELATRLAAGSTATYHATYAVSGPTSQTTEVWRSGQNFRQDSVTGAVRVETFITPEQSVQCRQASASSGFVCGAIGGAAPSGPVAVPSELTGVDVVARDDEIGGRSVRCFSDARAAGTVELCVTDAGIAVREVVGEQRIELTSLDATVDPAVFTPPAGVPLTAASTGG
jgi:hypothetical protein